MEPETDPGIEPTKGIDKPLIAAGVFVLLGFTPISVFEAILSYGYFGPLAWPAILAMVGVLFSVIALLRSLDLQDTTMRNWAIGIMAIGLFRLMPLPFF